MSLNVVTGIGPRVGSSFVMQQCVKAKYLVNGDKFLGGLLPKEGNPGGYYDLLPKQVAKVEQGIAKVWPVSLVNLQVPVNKLIILHRKSLEDQLNSIEKQIEREPITLDVTPENLVTSAELFLNSWLDSQTNLEYRYYFTENLDSDIEEIVTFLGD
jgi:hypothetical protein